MPPLTPLEELFATSSGSQLVSYRFESKSLKFQLLHARVGLLGFVVPTDTVHGRTVRDEPRRPLCRVEIIDLRQSLFIRDGRYLAPTEPDQFRDHARNRTTLAYGRRASEHRWLLSIKGEYPLLVCLVRDLADIEWTID